MNLCCNYYYYYKIKHFSDPSARHIACTGAEHSDPRARDGNGLITNIIDIHFVSANMAQYFDKPVFC